MIKLLFLTVLIIKFHEIVSITKTFRFNVNADNPENFVESDDCRGFQFPKSFENACMMSLGKIETNELFLPANGEIVFRENADILFTEKSKNCIKVKQPSYKEWINPSSWSSELSENLAVPHMEKTPCDCDAVVFPKAALYSVRLHDQFYVVDNMKVRDMQLEDYKRTSMLDGCPEFLGPLYRIGQLKGLLEAIHQKRCNRPSGQKCSYNGFSSSIETACGIFQAEEVKCSQPVELIGHCGGFCGGVIILRYTDKEYYKRIPIEKYIKTSEDIDFYDSVIESGTIQISITDKNDFTGDSILRAQKLYEDIKSIAEEYNIKSTKLMTSGTPLFAGKLAKSTIGVILGTLVFVLSTFAVLYAFYEGPFRHYTFSSRFNLSRYNQALRRSVIFSRFDNRGGGVSIAGSVMSLEKAFDNPMFGQPVPSTSYDSSTETVVDDAGEVLEEIVGKVDEDTPKGTEFKNPMYEDNKGIETVIMDEETVED